VSGFRGGQNTAVKNAKCRRIVSSDGWGTQISLITVSILCLLGRNLKRDNRCTFVKTARPAKKTTVAAYSAY
jgi:hypothetical protein